MAQTIDKTRASVYYRITQRYVTFHNAIAAQYPAIF